jgi:hypothetical protein
MKSFKKGIAILLISMVAFTSFGCYGSFAVTKKIHAWNGKVTGNKIVNTIVYWVLFIIPVYPVCAGLIDGLVLNTIEWWLGSNPMAMNEGDREVQIVNNEGVNYEIVATKNRFDVTVLDGEKAGKHVSLIYNDNTMIWSVENGAEKVEVAQMDTNNPEKMRILLPGLEGKIVDINM